MSESTENVSEEASAEEAEAEETGAEEASAEAAEAEETGAEETGEKKGGVRKWILFAVKALFSIAMLVVIFRKVILRDGSVDLGERLGQISWGWVAAAVLMQLTAIAFATVRWRTLLKGQGIKPSWGFLSGSIMIARFWGAFTPAASPASAAGASTTWPATPARPPAPPRPSAPRWCSARRPSAPSSWGPRSSASPWSAPAA